MGKLEEKKKKEGNPITQGVHACRRYFNNIIAILIYTSSHHQILSTCAGSDMGTLMDDEDVNIGEGKTGELVTAVW